jgi:hypothetical protein
MAASRMDELVLKTLTVSTEMSLPSGSVENDDVAAAADIATTKMKHRHAIPYSQADGADVASETKLVHLAYLAGTIVAINVRVNTAPTGGDKAFTVDVKKASDAGAFATVLSSVVTVDSGSTDNTKVAATIDGNEETLTADDAIQVVITASGSTGSQGQGLIVEIIVEEDGQ